MDMLIFDNLDPSGDYPWELPILKILTSGGGGAEIDGQL